MDPIATAGPKVLTYPIEELWQRRDSSPRVEGHDSDSEAKDECDDQGKDPAEGHARHSQNQGTQIIKVKHPKDPKVVAKVKVSKRQDKNRKHQSESEAQDDSNALLHRQS